MSSAETLARDNARLLEQGLDVLATLDPQAYRKAEPAVAGSTIGGHLRHVLDHYASFFAGGRRIDYDARARELELETSPAAAGERMRGYAARLRRLALDGTGDGTGEGTGERLVKVDTGHPAWSSSCVARELQFLASHTVHHYALIGVILRLNGAGVPEAFGVAPSTLRHRAESEPCAR